MFSCHNPGRAKRCVFPTIELANDVLVYPFLCIDVPYSRSSPKESDWRRLGAGSLVGSRRRFFGSSALFGGSLPLGSRRRRPNHRVERTAGRRGNFAYATEFSCPDCRSLLSLGKQYHPPNATSVKEP